MFKSINKVTKQINMDHPVSSIADIDHKLQKLTGNWSNLRNMSTMLKSDLFMQLHKRLTTIAPQATVILNAETGWNDHLCKFEIQHALRLIKTIAKAVPTLQRPMPIQIEKGLGNVHCASLGTVFAIVNEERVFSKVFDIYARNMAIGNPVLFACPRDKFLTGKLISSLLSDTADEFFDLVYTHSEDNARIAEKEEVKVVYIKDTTEECRKIAAVAGRNVKPCNFEPLKHRAFVLLSPQNLPRATRQLVKYIHEHHGHTFIDLGYPLKIFIKEELKESFISALVELLKIKDINSGTVEGLLNSSVEDKNDRSYGCSLSTFKEINALTEILNEEDFQQIKVFSWENDDVEDFASDLRSSEIIMNEIETAHFDVNPWLTKTDQQSRFMRDMIRSFGSFKSIIRAKGV